MKVKYSIIPFIPAVLAMLFFRVMSVLGVDESGNFLGMDRMVLAYTVIGIAIGLFVICILINIFDRKTAQVYPVRKNFAAGALAILSGIAVMASSCSAFFATTTDSEYYLIALITAIFSIPAGIAFALMAKVHFTGKSNVSASSILFVFPALWGCTELVFEFLNATKVSISATDLSGLFCYIFITLYYFSHSMVLSRIKGRNPVKACFIYGLPAAALAISHGVYVFLTTSQEGMAYEMILSAVQFCLLGVYALSFIIEMFIHSYTKDELEIVDSLPENAEEEEKKYINTGGYDDLVFSNSASSTEPNVDPADDYYSSAKGLDDFIMGFDKPDEEEAPEKQQKADKKAEKKAAKKAAKAEKAQPAEPEVPAEPVVEAEPVAPVEEVIPEPVQVEPVAEAIPEPAVPASPEAPAQPVQSELEAELNKLSGNTPEPAPAVEEINLSDVAAETTQDSDEKVAARLSEIDKLLQELDSKSE